MILILWLLTRRPQAVISSAGDGYFESLIMENPGRDQWQDFIIHYLAGLALDLGDPKILLYLHLNQPGRHIPLKVQDQ